MSISASARPPTTTAISTRCPCCRRSRRRRLRSSSRLRPCNLPRPWRPGRCSRSQSPPSRSPFRPYSPRSRRLIRRRPRSRLSPRRPIPRRLRLIPCLPVCPPGRPRQPRPRRWPPRRFRTLCPSMARLLLPTPSLTPFRRLRSRPRPSRASLPVPSLRGRRRRPSSLRRPSTRRLPRSFPTVSRSVSAPARWRLGRRPSFASRCRRRPYDRWPRFAPGVPSRRNASPTSSTHRRDGCVRCLRSARRTAASKRFPATRSCCCSSRRLLRSRP